MGEFAALSRQPTLSTRVTEQLLDAIATGRFRPGDRLPSERDLSEQFGVSRTVIREALRLLDAKGVLELSSGRGMQIAKVSSTRVTEAFEVYLRGAQSQDLIQPLHIAEIRETLETKLVELACLRAEDADLEAIGAELDLMAASPDAETAARHDAEFHRLLAVATHNALFVTLIESINTTMRTIRTNSLLVEGRLELALAEHTAILEALRSRDPRATRAAMQHHLDDSLNYYDSGVARRDAGDAAGDA